MLEVKGELVFKTVAYHRAADAIGREPGRPRGGLPGRRRRRGSRASARRSATRSRSSPRPATWPSTTGCAPRSRRPRRPAAHPGPRAQDRPPAPRRSSGSSRSRTSGAAAEAGRLRDLRGMSAKTEALDPRGDRPARRHARPDAARPGRGARRRRSSTRLAGTPGRARASSRRARSAAGARRSATSTSSPRPTTPAALIERVHDARARSTAS